MASSSASDPQITRNPAAVRRGHICSSSCSFIVATDASGSAGAIAWTASRIGAIAAASDPVVRTSSAEAVEISGADRLVEHGIRGPVEYPGAMSPATPTTSACAPLGPSLHDLAERRSGPATAARAMVSLTITAPPVSSSASVNSRPARRGNAERLEVAGAGRVEHEPACTTWWCSRACSSTRSRCAESRPRRARDPRAPPSVPVLPTTRSTTSRATSAPPARLRIHTATGSSCATTRWSRGEPEIDVVRVPEAANEEKRRWRGTASTRRSAP